MLEGRGLNRLEEQANKNMMKYNKAMPSHTPGKERSLEPLAATQPEHSCFRSTAVGKVHKFWYTAN